MIAVIGFSDLHVMQFLEKYTNVFDKYDIDYKVIYWNRSLVENNIKNKEKYISFDYKINTYQPFYKKILGFLKYARFVRKLINKNKYEKLVILTTQTAIPLYDILIKKYKDKYIYDYRDITKEFKLSFYKKMVIKMIKNSKYTMFSSKGFIKALNLENSNKILIANNSRDFKNINIHK